MAEYLDFLNKQASIPKSIGNPGGENLRAALIESRGITMEKATQSRQWAKDLGLSEEVVLSAEDRTREEATAQTIENSSSLADWAGKSRLNAVFARDNAEGLTAFLDGSIQTQEELDAEYGPLLTGGLYWGRGGSYIVSAFPGIARAVLETRLEQLESNPQEAPVRGPNYFPTQEQSGGDAGSLRAQINALNQFITDFRGEDVTLPEAETGFGQSIYNSLEIGPQLLAAGAAGAVGGVPGATAFMAGITGEAQYSSLRKQGVAPGRAAGASVLTVAANAPVEFLQLGRFLSILRGGKGIRAVAKRTFDAVGTNMLTEGMQGVIEQGIANEATGGDFTDNMAESFRQGLYEGALMAPYALLGGGFGMIRARREARQSQTWTDRQRTLYKEAQALLPDKGGDPVSLESALLAASPEMRQLIFLSAYGLEEAGQRVVGIDEALGLEVNNTDMDRVSAVPLASLYARLTPEQFEAVLPIARRSMEADSRNEAMAKSDRTLAELTRRAEIEATAVDIRDMDDATQQLRDDVRAAAANVAQPSDLGQALVSSQALATYLQSAMPEERATLLAGLGVAEEELSGTDNLFIELDSALPQINQNPLFDGFVDLLQLESDEDAAARNAVLEELGAPLQIIERAGADVNNRTRGELEKELRAAGRTASQAKREIEILSRLSSTIAQITGQDAGELARNTVRFKKAQAATGGAMFSQAAMPDAVGAIDQETASMIGLPMAGALRLTDGDLAAIEQRHGQQFKQAGFADGREFIGYALSHVDAVYKGRGNAYSFVSRGDNKDGRVFAEFEVVEENGSYRITTAHPVRESFFKKEIPLWDRSHAHPSTEADPIIAVDQGEAELQLNLTATPPKVKSSFEQPAFNASPPVESDAFKKWFGESKVVDENGQPLVVHHGTRERFEAFDPKTIENGKGKGSFQGFKIGKLGFYFTNDIEYADAISKEKFTGGEPNILNVYLSLQNPLIMSDSGWGSAVRQTDIRESDLRRWAEEGRHDGIIVESSDEILVDDDGREYTDKVYIAFRPEQIKSVDNRGTFDMNDPRILYQNQEGPRGFMEALSDGTFNIVLTKDQDASTAVHEFAHLFRELTNNVLQLPEEQIKDRPAFERLAAGAADVEAWLARFDDEATLTAEYDKYQKANYGGREYGQLNADEKATVLNTARHEYFARGFESYLLEGKAPSQGLRAVFQKMKQVLLDM